MTDAELVATFTKTIDRLNGKLQEYQEHIKTLQHELVSLREDTTAQQLEVENEDLKRTNVDLRKHISNMRTELDQKKYYTPQRMKKLGALLKQRDLLLRKAKTKIEELRTAANKEAERAATMHDANTLLKNENETLRGAIARLTTKIGGMEKYINQDKQSTAALQKERNEAKAAVNAIKQIAKQQRDQIAELKQMQHTFEDKLANESKERVKAVVQHQARQNLQYVTKIETLQREIDMLQNVIDAKAEKERELGSEINQKLHELMAMRRGVVRTPSKRALVKTAPIQVPQVKETYSEEEIMHHLIPMVEVALDHGDTDQQIIESLTSSGHAVEHVRNAIEKVRN